MEENLKENVWKDVRSKILLLSSPTQITEIIEILTHFEISNNQLELLKLENVFLSLFQKLMIYNFEGR
jgi:hypothetical protein